jgi:hypothetical protein
MAPLEYNMRRVRPNQNGMTQHDMKEPRARNGSRVGVSVSLSEDG